MTRCRAPLCSTPDNEVCAADVCHRSAVEPVRKINGVELLHEKPCAWPQARCTCPLKLETTLADFHPDALSPQQRKSLPMPDRTTSTLRVNASTLAALLLPPEPPTRHFERAPTVKLISIEGPATDVEKGGTSLLIDIEHDGGLPKGEFILADLPIAYRRSFAWRFPELGDVSTIAVAQELLDEMPASQQQAVIRYLASRFGVAL